MRIKHTHGYNKDEAANRIEQMFNLLETKKQGVVSQVKTRWDSSRTKMEYSFLISGQKIAGIIQCADNLVEFEAKLPLALRLFQSKIENMVQEKIVEVFA